MSDILQEWIRLDVLENGHQSMRLGLSANVPFNILSFCSLLSTWMMMSEMISPLLNFPGLLEWNWDNHVYTSAPKQGIFQRPTDGHGKAIVLTTGGS